MSAERAEPDAGGAVSGGVPATRPWQAPVELPPPSGPRVDWGGVVHLSNDDSASLASAQRLLWALERGASFTLAQIRPHELLNWFGFDLAEPAPGDTFGVRAAALQADADTLAMTFAVKGATPPRPPMDLTILVDRSGSMSAEGRMAYVQRALGRAARELHPGDRVSLVLFDHEVCTPVHNLVVGRDDLSVLTREIDRMQPRGSTDLDLGLREAYRIAIGHTAEPGRARRVMALTDAILNTGEVRPDVVTEVARGFDAHGIRLTGVGVGREFRDDVLDQLTEKGKGAYVFLGDERAVDRLFGRGFDGLVHVLAEDVRFALDLPPSLGLERFYGEEASSNPDDVQPVSFQAGNHQVFFQDLTVRDARVVPSDAVSLAVSWTDPVSGQRVGQTWAWTVGELLRADGRNVRKARALHAFADVLMAEATTGSGCGRELDGWILARDAVGADAEIAWVEGLVAKRCDTRRTVAPLSWAPPAPAASPTRVKLDADTPIAEVALACPRGTESRTLTAGTSVASFTTDPGSCRVTLYGNVPMTAQIDVPPTGRDVRCVVRGGRLSCL
jgi:Ca-activated chloride channel family protein